jgi:GAF domain-containing protein
MSEMLPLAEELSQVYARMSGLLLSEETVQTALDLVTSLALDTIGGAVGAGVTLIDPDGNRESAAATSPLVARADALQYDLDEGPCLTAWADNVQVRIDDLQTDERWPSWRRAALPLGLRSSLSTPMQAQGRVLGALKVYGERPDAFGDRSAVLATRFAAQAAILLANVSTLDRAERLSESLQSALRSRNVIALANGVLMERYHLTEEQAFLRLVESARAERRELVDEATLVTRSTSLEHG